MKKTYKTLGVIAAMIIAANAHANEQQTTSCIAVHQEPQTEESLYATRGIHVYILLKEIIIDVLNIDEDQVIMEATLRGDLGADSLDICAICMQCEKSFGITVYPEYVSFFITVADLYDYILRETNLL